jgi:hypothetical protein
LPLVCYRRDDVLSTVEIAVIEDGGRVTPPGGIVPTVGCSLGVFGDIIKPRGWSVCAAPNELETKRQKIPTAAKTKYLPGSNFLFAMCFSSSKKTNPSPLPKTNNSEGV